MLTLITEKEDTSSKDNSDFDSEVNMDFGEKSKEEEDSEMWSSHTGASSNRVSSMASLKCILEDVEIEDGNMHDKQRMRLDGAGQADSSKC